MKTSSELILNQDGSIYHLDLFPEDIATTIILVGDPDRVPEVSRHFDTITVKKGKREFITHTGTLRGNRITVISTGIGTDNIDIVFNELDALVNVDLKTGIAHDELKSLNFIRIGTTGTMQPDIPVDSYLLSEFGIGFDNLLHFYQSERVRMTELEKKLLEHISRSSSENSIPYAIPCSKELSERFIFPELLRGITVTNSGFYGPQYRKLRLNPVDIDMPARLQSFKFNDLQITNFEMETSGIYGLAALMGHHAISLNCILANRATNTFSEQPKTAVKELIKLILERI
ncbi:nucleoside phosphorylase [Robertkochia solimangrovi]|uniref:nucleoside phosphorylase n=1 Tax=Robertkochia solimangrovi TaxID=2213046 RepID=UPI00117C36B6|nr:nucleoside phosphorylase [Robertkochia solimangrovi]TRZ45261.1 phosphorylase [Robertkochia solimangrovi]